MTRRFVLVALLSSLIAASPAAPPYHQPAGIADLKAPFIVAGYRALFTCSAHFFAGRPLEDIRKVELFDVANLGFPDPVIDEQRRLVTAADPSGKILRIAVYRDTMGCTILPPQWQIGDIPRLPYVEYAVPADVSRIAFPAGDQ